MGNIITLDQLRKITYGSVTKRQDSNMKSFADAVNNYGAKFGMDKLYNLSSLIGQVMVESGEFNYDREIWGPTPAQKRYDTRTDLGNTPEVDGDGFKHRGFGPLQLTGAYNQGEFYHWCLRNHVEYGLPAPPDFKKDPTKIVTDPWEGLSVLWYWGFGNPEHVSLNKYSSQNNQLMVTKKINGGTTHYDRRLDYQARAALVLLGFGTSRAEVKRFQRTHRMAGAIDGIVGDMTRAALHQAMSGENPLRETVEVPVTIEKPVVPVAVEHEVKKKTGRWGWLTGIFGGGGLTLGWLSGVEWQAIVAVGGILALFVVIILLMRHQLVETVRGIRDAVESD